MRLTVIIPVYNAEKYIEESVESVEYEFAEKAEIIIVNDGSTDSTDIICQKLKSMYSNIKYISKCNEGVSVARNAALSFAAGQWIMFLDADDKIMSGASDVLKYLNDENDILLCNYSRKDNIKEVTNIIKADIPTDLMKKGILNLPSYINQICKYSYKIDGINNWTCWAKIFRKDILDGVKFPEGVTHGEDLLFCYQAYSKAKTVTFCSVNLYYYRENNESVSQKFNIRRISNTLNLFEFFLQIDDSLINNKDFRYFVVDRTLACIKLYYASKQNKMPFKEKKIELRELLKRDVINDSINKCSLHKLSISRKRSILNGIVLILIKNKMYGLGILLAKI